MKLRAMVTVVTRYRDYDVTTITILGNQDMPLENQTIDGQSFEVKEKESPWHAGQMVSVNLESEGKK